MIVVGALLGLAIIGNLLPDSSDEAVTEAGRTSEEDDDAVATTTTEPPAPSTTIDLAVLEAEYGAQVANSCAQAVSAPLHLTDVEAAEAESSAYDDDWEPHASRSQFTQEVLACAAPQRAARLAEECGAEPPVELLNRDPDQFIGQCFTVVVLISQFDQGTGPCSFRAYFDSRAREYNFEYLGENALVNFDEPCPDLDPIGTGDVLQMQAVVLGGLEYETTMGGRSTAVQLVPVGGFQVLQDN